MNTFSSLQARLTGSSLRIVFIPHETPDADALGSALALAIYCQQLGHRTQIVSPNGFPSFLNWLPQADQIIQYDQSPNRATTAIQAAELLVMVDFSTLSRLGALGTLVQSSSTHKALLDHHPNLEKGLADTVLHYPKAAATAEIIYDFIEATNSIERITADLATCLYAGIVTDTRSFRYSRNPARLHEIAYHIILQGKIDVEDIHEQLYDSYAEGRMRLLGYALSSCLKVLPDYSTAYFVLRNKDLERFNANNGDTEGLVNYALAMKGIQLAVLIKERGNEVRLSLRSKGDFSVGDLAEKHFDGGGHRNAAGGHSLEPIEVIEERFCTILQDYQSILNSK